MNNKIAIGGMIGAGKSTLAEALSKDLNLELVNEFEKGDSVFETLLQWQYQKIEHTSLILQIYFVHNLHAQQSKLKTKEYIVDRDILEHRIFAEMNLKDDRVAFQTYKKVFDNYMLYVHKPRKYIILDITWETFLNRVFKRGRKVELDNLESNLEYFKDLHEIYTTRLVEFCEKWSIDYEVVDANNLTEVEILNKVKGLL